MLIRFKTVKFKLPPIQQNLRNLSLIHRMILFSNITTDFFQP